MDGQYCVGLLIVIINGFLSAFGDSRKRNIICSSCKPRQGGHALPSRDSLPRVHDVGPDGSATACRAISHALTHLRDATPPVTRVATRPRRGPVPAHAGRQSVPAHHVGPPRSGG